jgi:hypothetical protein
MSLTDTCLKMVARAINQFFPSYVKLLETSMSTYIDSIEIGSIFLQIYFLILISSYSYWPLSPASLL